MWVEYFPSKNSILPVGLPIIATAKDFKDIITIQETI